MKCRHCEAELSLCLIDLGSAPLSNAYLTERTLKASEKWFPLKVLVCKECWLVQTEDYTRAEELFDQEYAYFSSISSSWLEHAKHYVEDMLNRFNLNSNSKVVEIAANDGYLLQYVKQKNIPCFGIEPTASTAKAAKDKGIEITEDFFSIDLAKKLVSEGKQADLIVANNVLAHVPSINDFVSGFAHLLKPNGVATFEFPHLMQMINLTQFDTIYHEHFSYLSLTAVHRILEHNRLQVFDVQEIATHGGSLRVFAQLKDKGKEPVMSAVSNLLNKESSVGVSTEVYYAQFQNRANQIKYDLIEFLIKVKREGRKVIAYGAAAKGNTLLNYAGIRPDLLPLIVDRNPAKKNKYLPGSRIPIVDEAVIHQQQPDYVLIMPWNLHQEVIEQLAYIRGWDGRFVIAVPNLEIL
jgi:2-polyprenyl-3-methyl-5-hydroxy-6-metoxy-1,4-benzoquinol methylase